jgi:hypothetical protein
VKTAETHGANVMWKLEIHSVSELVRYAVRNQIIEAQRTRKGLDPDRSRTVASVFAKWSLGPMVCSHIGWPPSIL